MFRKLAVFGLAASLALVSACQSGGYDSQQMAAMFPPGATYYLKTNLHADSAKPVLYSTNYQQAVLLPVCSEVTIDSMSGKELAFTHVPTGRQYTYKRDKHLQESFDANVGRYFGSECPQSKIDSMSDIDQQGIKAGRAMVGMTKEGVLIACGYPPDHATPTLDLQTWQYWKNRWARRVVNFNADGIVTSIDG